MRTPSDEKSLADDKSPARDAEVALLQEALREVQGRLEAEYAARRDLATQLAARTGDLDSLRAERDAARAELAALRASRLGRLWRLLAPLRRLRGGR